METKTINSKCVVAILILWSMGFTSAGQELNLTIEPATLNLNSSNTFTIINTGTNPLPYTIEANTSFRTSHFNQLTTWNEEPISAGPADTAAIPNNAKWTTEIAFSDDFNESILTYSLYSPMGPGSMGTGNINGEVGWASERDNWDCVRPYPHIIASYLRGRADGSGIPSGVFSPKAVTGTENISSISMDVNFDYSSGSTWQFIPQSTNTNLVVTRLQINPDHTLQVLVKDEFENASFQRILTELPLGGFALSMEVDRKTSVFTIFFNGLKVFTGRGFSNSISQMAMITLNEKAGSALFFNGFLTHSLLPGNDFVINSCSSLILVYEDFDYNGKSKINGTLQSGESLTRQLDFSVSDLSPGIYRDSIKISTNESDQPVAFLPYSITLENPYEMPGDYHFTSVAPMTLTYDTLEATVYKGDSAIIHLNLNNSSTVEQSVYFPDAIQNPSGYRAFSRGSQNFQWKDISSTGTALTLGNDDSQVVEIPFSGSITIGSNGYMIFGTTRADDPDNMPMYDTYRYLYNTLAPYWDDLAPDDSSSIKYQTIADEFIVQYTNVL
ncbi:MAG TPA: hypothetical protein PKU83_04825, partial [Chryseolinea sp.]|nr:hypothetical protein [Chryseolinea sp.]